jgi:hypothetical protein
MVSFVDVNSTSNVVTVTDDVTATAVADYYDYDYAIALYSTVNDATFLDNFVIDEHLLY